MSSVSFPLSSHTTRLKSSLYEQEREEAQVRQIQMANFLQGVKEAELVVRMNPRNPRAHRILGIAFMMGATLNKDTSLQEYRCAIQHFRQTINISITATSDSSQFEDWHCLALCHLGLNELQHAIVALGAAKKKIDMVFTRETPDSIKRHKKIDSIFAKIRAAAPQLIESFSKEMLELKNKKA